MESILLILSLLAANTDVVDAEEFDRATAIAMQQVERTKRKLPSDTTVRVSVVQCPERSGAGRCFQVAFSAPLPPRSLGSEEFLRFVVDLHTKKILEVQ